MSKWNKCDMCVRCNVKKNLFRAIWTVFHAFEKILLNILIYPNGLILQFHVLRQNIWIIFKTLLQNKSITHVTYRPNEKIGSYQICLKVI